LATTLAAMKLERLRYLRDLQQRAGQVKKDVSQYYSDPLGFAANCIDWRGEGLTGYQKEIIGSLPEKKRIAARGPHGLGKSTLAAITLLWFALTSDAAGVDWKVVTTAGAWRQLINYLWPEVHKWAGRVKWEHVRDTPFSRSELLNLNMRLSHGQAFAAACTNPALIEGAHADRLLFIYDESKAIPAVTFDACEGAFSGTGEALALALSTPGDPSGRFFDIHAHKAGYEDWHARHVTLEEAIAAGRISREWAEQRRKQWGEGSAVYVNRVLGNFHAGDEDTVIPLSWAEAANERWLEWDEAGRPELPGPHTDGVDVARSGEDSTVIAIRRGPVVVELRRSSKEDTMQTTGRVKGHLDSDPLATAMVDVIGIGAGVLDRLREQGCRAQAFNASAGTHNHDATGELGFINTRSAAWWLVRELLDPSRDPDTCLPVDDLLLGDLTAPKWKVMSGGKIQVESKDDIRKRIGRSTDAGDAVVQSYWEEDSGAGKWIEWARKKAELAQAEAADDSESAPAPQPEPAAPIPPPRFSPSQLADARKLIALGGITPAGQPGEYRALSSNGSGSYLVTADGCQCQAGQHGKPCKHRAAVMLLPADGTAPVVAVNPVSARQAARTAEMRANPNGWR
jgi:hypothetical protein